jgi:glycosyltransferase involved in cell wall biosynthesis
MTNALLPCYLDEPLPERFVVGAGNVLLLKGWAYSPFSRLASLSVTVGGKTYPVPNHSIVRHDVFHDQFSERDREGNSLLSGFFAMVPVESIKEAFSATVTFTAISVDGRRSERTLGSIWMEPSAREPLTVQWPDDGPKVAICMATYNPPAALFRRQIESLRLQTHRNWFCIITDDQSPAAAFQDMQEVIGDDPRFVLLPNDQRLNFYRNFERAMSLVPLDADFVALCDQDDRWDDDKIEALLSAFDDSTQLVYSDCRLTDGEGTVLADTFWHNRRNNYRNLQALLVANTVTGAASLFRTSLLDKILPLPMRIGDAYHDHWMAVIAMAEGGIGYVDRPLYDYVQHGANVIGHNYGSGHPGFTRYGLALLSRIHSPQRFLEATRIVLNNGSSAFPFVVRTALVSRVALLRSDRVKPKRKRILEKFARYNESLWVPFSEKALSLVQRRPTLNLEGFLLFSAVATRAFTAHHTRRRRESVAPPPPAPAPPPAPHVYIDEIQTNVPRMNAMQRLFLQHPVDG